MTECNEAFSGFLLQVCMGLIFNHHCWIYDISLAKVIEKEKKQENNYCKASIPYPVAIYMYELAV